MMRRTVLTVIAASLVSCERQPIESASASFEQHLSALRAYFHIPGMAAIVARNGEVVYEGYFGYADLEAERLVDSTTIFPIASVTKTFAYHAAHATGRGRRPGFERTD